MLLSLKCGWVLGQYEVLHDSSYNDTAIYESSSGLDYDPNYHFDDSAQSHYEQSNTQAKFDSAYWKNLVRNMTFQEKPIEKDSIKKKPAQVHKNTSHALP